MEYHLLWESTFDGRCPSMEEKTLMVDYLQGETTFEGQHPLVEDYLRSRTSFDGKLPLIEEQEQETTHISTIMQSNLEQKFTLLNDHFLSNLAILNVFKSPLIFSPLNHVQASNTSFSPNMS